MPISKWLSPIRQVGTVARDKQREPNGYQYSQFCRRYRERQPRVAIVMRQEHRSGESIS